MLTSPSTVPDVAVDSETRKRLLRIAKKIRELEVEQDDLIRKARAEGASLREIAELINVNHVTVKNMLERRPWTLDDPEVRY